VTSGPARLGLLCDGLLMSDADIGRFADQPTERPWAQADLLSDGRHNSPAGATSVGTTHIRFIYGQGFRSGLTCMPTPRLARAGQLTAAFCSNAGRSRRGRCRLTS
jgi:hypothetical protein